MEKIQITLEPVDNKRLLNLGGPLDTNLKEIELRFDVEINQRGNLFNFVGLKNINLASNFIKELYLKTEEKNISLSDLRNYLQQPSILEINIPSENKKENTAFLKLKIIKLILKNPKIKLIIIQF